MPCLFPRSDDRNRHYPPTRTNLQTATNKEPQEIIPEINNQPQKHTTTVLHLRLEHGLLAETAVAIIVETIAQLGPRGGTDGKIANPGGWGLSVPALPKQILAEPDLSLVGQFSFGAFERIGALAALMLVFTLVFTNFFDAMGTFTRLSREAGHPTPSSSNPAPVSAWERS